MADGLDLSSLAGIKGQASAAVEQVANLTQATPGLLQQLQGNLTSIFAKDNPLIQARGQALSDFLSTPARARAEYLPANLPQVEGSNLNLSPTQQNALTTARSSAALAPLAGLNQIITGIYGNIPQMVQNASGLYQGQIQAAQLRANQLQQQYENELNEILKQEATRQFNIQEQRLGKASSGSGLNLPDWWTNPPPATSSAPVYGPPAPTSSWIADEQQDEQEQPNWQASLLNLLIPGNPFGPQPKQTGPDLSGYDFSNVKL